MSAEHGHLSACIRFLSVEDGGRLSWAESGIRPQLRLGDISTSCIINSADGARQFEPGVDHIVNIHLMHWDQVASLVDLNDPVVLLEGSRVIARGKFIA